VNVIGHQAVTDHSHAVLLNALLEQVEVDPALLLVSRMKRRAFPRWVM
jgi:hypothetical protein